MKLPRIVTRDWTRKLVAVILATVVYAAVRFQLQTEERFSGIEVLVRCADSNMMVLDDTRLTTNIVLRGTEKSLNDIKQVPVVEHVVPTGTPSGIHAFRLGPEDVKLPGGDSLPRDVRVVEDGFQPKELAVQLERIRTKEVKIRLRLLKETLPPDRAVERAVIHPTKATIRGPAKYLDAITEVVTEDVAFDEAPPPSYELDVGLRDIPQVNIMRPDHVRVSLELGHSRDTRQYDEIPLDVHTQPGSNLYIAEFLDREHLGDEFFDEETGRPLITVTVEGPPSTLDFLTRNSIRAFVELFENQGEGTRNLRVRIWIHARDCQWQRYEPTTIKARVARRKGD